MDDDYPGSGADTPGESAVSNVIDVGATNEEKARVLRRHLVSKEERRAGDTTPTAGDSGVILAEGSGHGGGSGYASVGGRSGSPGQASGSKSRTGSEHEESFPIPYDAPGGDVT
jgi:proton-coupled amino acid transporter